MLYADLSAVDRTQLIYTATTEQILLALNVSCASFLNALRRFISRRSNPIHLYRDNGTNFVGAERVLRESIQNLDQRKINEFLSLKNINWHFNPPNASHMGGAWERMIKSVRRILSITFKGQVLTDDALQTIIIEIEAIVNSRPLIPITFDPKDDEPLTPNHLLLLQGVVPLPPGVYDKKECYAQIQYLSDQFWRHFVREYLPNLQHR